MIPHFCRNCGQRLESNRPGYCPEPACHMAACLEAQAAAGPPDTVGQAVAALQQFAAPPDARERRCYCGKRELGEVNSRFVPSDGPRGVLHGRDECVHRAPPAFRPGPPKPPWVAPTPSPVVESRRIVQAIGGEVLLQPGAQYSARHVAQGLFRPTRTVVTGDSTGVLVESLCVGCDYLFGDIALELFRFGDPKDPKWVPPEDTFRLAYRTAMPGITIAFALRNTNDRPATFRIAMLGEYMDSAAGMLIG